MNLNALTAISPVDGRYRSKTTALSPYFSEYGLIRYRVRIEIAYFIALSKVGLEPFNFSADDKIKTVLNNIWQNFTVEQAQRIKDIESTTNHDVKAVEYFLKEELEKLGLNDHREWIHFGLTSQDINNTAIPLSLKEACENVIIPQYKLLALKLHELSIQWKEVPMLARTHGQPASPTRLGKEIKVFAERLDIQLAQLANIPFSAKFGGATGNFNAHHQAFPDTSWVEFANNFVNTDLGLSRSQTTTQIEHYDNLAALCDNFKRLNNILIDLSRDIWSYISMDYFKQKIKDGEIGSSAMPHKVNPIDFENAEGNLGFANSMLEHFSAKLPISRLQRDLTDSTVLRNIGVPLSHVLISLQSLDKGFGKLILNKDAIDADLEKNWAVVAEAIQTVLRAERYPNPYEALKSLTRTNEAINKESIHKFIETLEVNDQVKEKLRKITPFTYTGI